jgi:hypothetical protein
VESKILLKNYLYVVDVNVLFTVLLRAKVLHGGLMDMIA